MSESDHDDGGPASRLRSWLKLKRKDRKREEALRDPMSDEEITALVQEARAAVWQQKQARKHES